jgi:hypothetical protein
MMRIWIWMTMTAVLAALLGGGEARAVTVYYERAVWEEALGPGRGTSSLETD